MKNISMVLVIVLALIVGLSLNNVYAQTQPAAEKADEAGVIVNDVCPVMGRPVSKDAKYKTTYEGQTIGFCCRGCVKKFEKDPEKYISNLKKTTDKVNE